MSTTEDRSLADAPGLEPGRLTELTGGADPGPGEVSAQALAQATAIRRALIEAASDGVLVIGNDGRYLDFNRRFAELWGLEDLAIASEEDQVVGRILECLADPEDFLAKLHSVRDQPGQVVHDEVMFKDGRVLERLTRPCQLGDRQFGRVATFRDVTEKRRVESSLRERVKELTCLHRVSQLLQSEIPGTGALLERLVALLPEAWRFPEAAQARIRLGELTAQTPGYRDSPWTQEARFTTGGGRRGRIQVVYPENPAGAGEAVFLDEEQAMLDSVAEQLHVYLDRREALEALHQGQLARQADEQRFRALVGNVPGAVYRCHNDSEWTLAFVSDAIETLIGYPAREFLEEPRRSLAALCHPDDRERFRVMANAALARGETFEIEYRLRHRDGSWRWVYGKGQGEAVEGGGIPWFVDGVLFDITDRKRSEDALRVSEERYRTLYDDNPSMFFTLDARGMILSVNDFGARQLGCRREDLTGISVFHLLHRDDRPLVRAQLAEVLARPLEVHRWECRKLRQDGEMLWVRETARASTGGDGRPVVLVVSEDCTEAYELSRELNYQACHDALTTLYNRREFERRLQAALESAHRDRNEHVLCYLDLDQFKVVNDTCGHVAGDELLRQLGAILKKQVRRQDVIARLGGDEFGVLMLDCGLSQGWQVADALRRAVQNFRFIWEQTTFSLGVSIGLVAIGADSPPMAAILSAADTACYAAKDAGRNRIHVYDPGDEELARRQGEMQWVARINQALEEDRFHLVAQEIRRLVPGAAGGRHFEVLLRMTDEQGGTILPGAFLPAAERYNLAVKLDRWVVRTVCEWLRRRPDQLSCLHHCAINLSGHSLGDGEFLDFVVQQLADGRVPADKLCFEITETAAIANLAEATGFMERLKELGCCFALDDFGSGLSSFAYLKNLPVDYLKIDGAFVKDMLIDPIDQAMVKSINDLGHVMGKRTIAEFVESRAVLERLQELGVDYAQGYIIGAPERLL